MKKTLMTFLLVFVVAISLTGCGSTTRLNDKTAEVVVNIAGGIPYEWVYSIEDAKVVKYKDMTEKSGETLGSSTEQHYIFEGLKEGITTIKFELKSITDDSIEETKNYDVVVDKDLKIIITEKSSQE